jgi:hypothetical protein
MRGNVVVAAVVFAGGLLLSSLLVVWGVGEALDRGMARFERAVHGHGRSVEQGGERAGAPIQQALKDVSAAMGRHGESVQQAGDKIAHPQIRMQDPIAVQQPVIIRGPTNDGALPVKAELGRGPQDADLPRQRGRNP